MSNSDYTIRNYQSSDFDKFVRLNIEAEKLEPTGHHVSPQLIAENLGRPNYSPEQDLFLVEIAGNIIGYMDMVPERTIGRVILSCWIHPEHRRRGLSRKLLSYSMQRAKELGAKVAHMRIMEDNVLAKSVLAKLGFECVRRYLELRLDISEVPQQALEQAAPGCRHLQPGEEGKLTRIQNRSFAGSWGYNPNTVEEIVHKTNLSNRSPENVILAYDGDKLVGYCWTEVTNNEEAGDRRAGQIYMMGTDPDYRGRGVGKRVLLTGLIYLKNRGARVTKLTVDSENQAALVLYRSVGFKVQTTSLWYEKVVD